MLATIPWAQGGIVGGLAVMTLGTILYFFRQITNGRLYPKSTVDDLRDAANQRVTDAEKHAERAAVEAAEYKAAWLAAEKARHEQDVQIGELMESSRTTIAILRSIAHTPVGEARDVVDP